jgi:hypothetical protein
MENSPPRHKQLAKSDMEPTKKKKTNMATNATHPADADDASDLSRKGITIGDELTLNVKTNNPSGKVTSTNKHDDLIVPHGVARAGNPIKQRKDSPTLQQPSAEVIEHQTLEKSLLKPPLLHADDMDTGLNAAYALANPRNDARATQTSISLENIQNVSKNEKPNMII